MKVIIALAALACFLNCDHGSPISTAESNSPNVSPQSSACETSAGGYQHKSEGQLASMSASQLFDEQVKEQHYHGAIG